jgi:hypothetical protein
MILHISKTKEFPLTSLFTKLNTGMLHKKSPLIPNIHTNTQKIWMTITFHAPLIRKLSHLLRNTNLKTTTFVTHYVQGLTTALQNTKVAFNRWNGKHVNFHM